MSAPAIRPARLTDAEAIGALHVRAWRWAYRGLLPDAVLDGLDPQQRAEQRRRLLAQPSSPLARNWVLERGGAVVGWCATGPCRDADVHAAHVGEIYALYLEPDEVGRGSGRALLAHAREALQAQGLERIVLWVLQGNTRGRRFYERAGFLLDATAPERQVRYQGAPLGAREVRYYATSSSQARQSGSSSAAHLP